MIRDWLDSEGNFLFGKYQGDHPTDLAYENPGYLKWILETVEDISEEDREIIEAALKRVKRRRGEI